MWPEVMAHIGISALGREKQRNSCGFKTSLIYSVSSRTARAVFQDFVSENSRKERRGAGGETVLEPVGSVILAQEAEAGGP